MSDTHDDLPHSEELAADIAEAEAEAGLDDGLGPIDALIAERDQWKDRALRAVAEAENTKKRAETQSNDARAYAIQRFARDLLGVADNLERALQAAPKDADAGEAGLVTGLELTQKSLLQAFESNNLKRVAPEPGEGGQVIQTLQAGYALFGRTVRPAMVVVAAKGSGAAAGNAAYAAAGATGGNFDQKA